MRFTDIFYVSTSSRAIYSNYDLIPSHFHSTLGLHKIASPNTCKKPARCANIKCLCFWFTKTCRMQYKKSLSLLLSDAFLHKKVCHSQWPIFIFNLINIIALAIARVKHYPSPKLLNLNQHYSSAFINTLICDFSAFFRDFKSKTTFLPHELHMCTDEKSC